MRSEFSEAVKRKKFGNTNPSYKFQVEIVLRENDLDGWNFNSDDLIEEFRSVGSFTIKDVTKLSSDHPDAL